MKISREANEAARAIVKIVEASTKRKVSMDAVTNVMWHVQAAMDKAVRSARRKRRKISTGTQIQKTALP